MDSRRQSFTRAVIFEYIYFEFLHRIMIGQMQISLPLRSILNFSSLVPPKKIPRCALVLDFQGGGNREKILKNRNILLYFAKEIGQREGDHYGKGR